MQEENTENLLSLEELNSLLDSKNAELTMVLDSVDGSFDGIVQTEVLNQWRTSKGLAADNFDSETLAILDAIKYITKVQESELSLQKLEF